MSALRAVAWHIVSSSVNIDIVRSVTAGKSLFEISKGN